MSQTITPYLLYEDVAQALEWLSKTFGFRENLRFEDSDSGRITHAEMQIGDMHIYLGHPGPEYRSPKSGGGNTVGIHVYVDDVDAHFERARMAGAEVTQEPSDQPYGDRSYNARDLEGHQWYFAQQIREVAPAEWGAKATA